MLGLVAAYLVGRWDADRAHDTLMLAAPYRPTSAASYDVPTVAERRAPRAGPDRRRTGLEVVLPLMAVLAVVVALLA